MSVTEQPARTLLAVAFALASGCVHDAPPVYLFSMRASSGPAPVIAVAYSRVVGPPLEVPSAMEGGVAFLRPSPRGLEVVGRAPRTPALHAILHGHPAYVHGAVGGARPWVALADEDWTDPADALPTRDLHGRKGAPLAAREPVALASGAVALQEDALVGLDDDGRTTWRHALATAEPASCPNPSSDRVTSRVAASPSGAVVAGIRARVHRDGTCVETVARLARLGPDGARLGPDVVVRLVPPEELWSAMPQPSRYGTTAIHVAVGDDGTTLLAFSARQPGPTSSGSDIRTVRLVEVTPDGTLVTLRAIPGVVRSIAPAGSSWALFLEPEGGEASPLLILASDGRPLGNFAIPRRRVAILSLPRGAFVAWRSSEHAICGMPVDEDGHRDRVVCQRVVPLETPAAGP